MQLPTDIVFNSSILDAHPASAQSCDTFARNEAARMLSLLFTLFFGIEQPSYLF